MKTKHDAALVRRAAAIVALGVLVVPAWGNPGAAAAMTSAFYVFLGTIGVIVIEAIVLKCMRAGWLVLLMAPVANVVSLIFGLLLVHPLHGAVWPHFGETMLDAAPLAAWVVFISLALLGPVIEWPLIALCFKGPRRFRRAVGPVLVASLVSNLGLGFLASLMFDHGLAWLKPVSPKEIVEEIEGPMPWVYFIEADEITISRIRLDGTGRAKVGEMPWEDARRADHRHLPIATLNAVEQDGAIRLVVSLAWWYRQGDRDIAWRPGFGPDDATMVPHPKYEGDEVWTALIDTTEGITAASMWNDIRDAPRAGTDRGFQRSRDLASEPEPAWGEDDYWWISEGLVDPMVGNRYSVESWADLPNGLAVFGFSRWYMGQPPSGVMLVSMKSYKRAWLAIDGWCPVVVYHDEPTPMTEPAAATEND